jgi:FdrA protein
MSAIVLNTVRRGFYLDSVALMRLSREIAAMPGVQEAALMMATPANKRILDDAGLLTSEGAAATANDLIFAVRAHSTDAANAAFSAASTALEKPRTSVKAAGDKHPRTLRAALREQPGSTLALISVPGEYATGEARNALRSGLDVMIFSDNVPLAEEVALKREAKAMGRVVMGPDCGTAIIDGTPLAFANRVPRGNIGVIGASGTGIQEVTCLIARSGKGISQAIGVGGRDLVREVGGLSTLAAIDLLDADPTTHRIVLISKPPHPEVARPVLARIALSCKQFTICFLGVTGMELPANACAAPTLRAAAEDAVGVQIGLSREAPPNLPSKSGAILGLYSGGTLAAEAQLILLSAGRSVASNAALPGVKALSDAAAGTDCIVDLGADEFTRARPHPMIDPAMRTDRLRSALADMALAVILLDVVIGLGAHADPAGQIASALAGAPPNRPHVVASVTGTEADPQVRSRQVATLQAAGVLVAQSNAGAVEQSLTLTRPWW